MYRHAFLTFITIGLVACAPSSKTGDANVDEIVDLIVNREAPFHDCIKVWSKSGLVAEFPEDFNAPNNGGWDVEQFEDPEVVEAARNIAVPLSEVFRLNEEAKVLYLFGDSELQADSCMMSISDPTFSGDFAFASFVSPDGTIGSYALERAGLGWYIKERVVFGYW